MENKIKLIYEKIARLFKEHKSDTDEYKREIEKILELTKDNAEFHSYYFEAKFMLAKFYDRKHKFDESQRLFLELINDDFLTDDKKLSSMEALAYQYRILKQFDNAVFWYEKILKICPNGYYYDTALDGLAKCSEMSKNFDNERKILYIKFDNYPSEEEIKELSQNIIRLKDKLLKQKDTKEKEQLENEIYNLEDTLNNTYYLVIDIKMKIAKSYFNEKNYEVCKNEIKSIFDLLQYRIGDKEDYAVTNANMLLGEVYFEENNFEKAREYFKPIADTPKDYKYMISDIHDARKFLGKMGE